MLWLIVVLALILFLVWTEDRSQNCLGKPCQHSGPPIRQYDDRNVTIDKTIYTVNLRHTVVEWRRSVLAALAITLLLFFIMKSSIPSASDFIIVALLLTLGYYLTSSWFIWSWVTPIDQGIVKALSSLRTSRKI
jgi:hypothetical protein